MIPSDFKDPFRFRSPSAERRKGRRWWIVSLGALILGLLLVGLGLILTVKPSSPPETPAEESSSAPQEPELRVIEGQVNENGTLFQSLADKGIAPPSIDLVVSKLKPYINFTKIKGGTFRYVSDPDGILVKFTYEAGPTEVYEIEKSGKGYEARQVNIPLETMRVKVVGDIRSSLFEAMNAAGEQDGLTLDFAEILAWEVDFYKDVREGDRFKLVVEKLYKGNEFIRYGVIHAVEYQGEGKRVRGIRYQDGYYDENGLSLRKVFLKAPLRFNRISSRFSRSRRHPILGGLRPHYGTDYAAPMGTPVWAVGDGTVVLCGWNGGYGRLVVLRHRNGYTTQYAHLSRFGVGIRVGKQVRQKQVIGYVGSTGLSTGSHLDYRLAKQGRFKNPLKETFPAGVALGKEEKEKFQKVKGVAVEWLEGDSSFQRLLPPPDSMKEAQKQ